MVVTKYAGAEANNGDLRTTAISPTGFTVYNDRTDETTAEWVAHIYLK